MRRVCWGGKSIETLGARIPLPPGQVILQNSDLRRLPPLKDPSPFAVEEMTLTDPAHIQQWCAIVNRSLGRSWGADGFQRTIVHHATYEVAHTFFLRLGSEPVGVVSAAVFQKNRQVGATHYLALDRAHRGRGLGKHLILHSLHVMRIRGVTRCEAETTLRHRMSLWIHFDLGFRPKLIPDDWNSPAPQRFGLVRNACLLGMFRRWRIAAKRSGAHR